MAAKHLTSKKRARRSQKTRGGAPTNTESPEANPSGSQVRTRSPLEQIIEAERGKLLEVQAVLKCLYGTLLYSIDNEAFQYADVVRVSAQLLGDAIERLDLVKLREAAKVTGKVTEVREPDVPYVVERRDAPSLTLPREQGRGSEDAESAGSQARHNEAPCMGRPFQLKSI